MRQWCIEEQSRSSKRLTPSFSNDPLIRNIRDKLERFLLLEGRRPRVLMGALKEPAPEGSLKLANYLVGIGFDVDISPAHMTPWMVAQMAIDHDVHIVCLCNVTKMDASAFKAIRVELGKACREALCIFGIGDVSPIDLESIGQAGCTGIFAWDSPFPEIVNGMLDQLHAPSRDLRKAEFYIDGVLARDRGTIARTISLIESRADQHRAVAERVLEGLFPYSGNSVRIGLSGIPGAGKSTFIERLGLRLLEKGKRVAVLAVDPSSFISGGSLLGDKTRMANLSTRLKAYIRPFSSGGVLGGVAGKTRETMIVCEAAGFDVILVETVGVGQSEIDVASMVDFFLLLQVAGAGDQFQGIKKGIIEMVDAIAITKADGDNLENARKACNVYAEALSMLQSRSDHWTPPVVSCSAYDPASIDEIWHIISQFVERLTNTGELAAKRSQQSAQWMMSILDQGMIERFCENPRVARRLDGILNSLEKGDITPDAAARILLSAYNSPPSVTVT